MAHFRLLRRCHSLWHFPSYSGESMSRFTRIVKAMNNSGGGTNGMKESCLPCACVCRCFLWAARDKWAWHTQAYFKRESPSSSALTTRQSKSTHTSISAAAGDEPKNLTLSLFFGVTTHTHHWQKIKYKVE